MSLPVSGDYYGAGAGVDGYKATAKFIPDVWSGKLQVKFYAATCMAEITNSDWEGEIKDQGDAVIIRSTPNITISDYQKGMTLSTQVPSSTPITLNIDKGKYFQVVVDDVDAVQSDLKLMNNFTDDASEQMKIAVETQVFGAVYADAHADNKGATAGKDSANINMGAAAAAVAISKTNAVDFIVDVNTVLDEQNVPETGRWIVIPPAYANRIKKSDLKDASMTGDSVSVMRNGRIGLIDRTTVYVSNNLAHNATEWNIMAGTRDAISFASQVTKMETLRSQTTFGDLVRGLNVYGYKVTKPEALVHGVVSFA